MALKFLNKKGWHTGSLRNIENVWKAEQKHNEEQRKLEELRKQIQEERERSEFRLIQQQAGLVPKQERLDFLYDSGLAVGKASSEGFKALEAVPKPEIDTSSSSKQQQSTPGALFEEKPQSANDAWRKLHSDPLLLIRQREQDALSRIKNNPVQMAMIRKSVEAKEEEKSERKERKRVGQKNKKHVKHSSRRGKSDSEDLDSETEETKKRIRRGERKKDYYKNSKHSKHSSRRCESDSEDFDSKGEGRKRGTRRGESDSERNKDDYKTSKYGKHSSRRGESDYEELDSEPEGKKKRSRHHEKNHGENSFIGRTDSRAEERERSPRKTKLEKHSTETNDVTTGRQWQTSCFKQRQISVKLSEEERAARLQEMQLNAKLHEEQRWKRLKKASEMDALEASQETSHGGRSFLDAAQKSVYGAEKGGSSTIEESVRRRKYYMQGRSEASEGSAFRR